MSQIRSNKLKYLSGNEVIKVFDVSNGKELKEIIINK